MKITKSQALKLFTVLQFKNADKYDLAKMNEKVNALGEIIDDAMIKSVVKKDAEVAKMLKDVLKAISKGSEVEVVEDPKTKKAAKPEKVVAKAGKKSKVVEEDEDEEDTDDDEEDDSEEDEEADEDADEDEEDEDEDTDSTDDEDDEEEEADEDEEEPVKKPKKGKKVADEDEDEEDDEEEETEDEDSDDEDEDEDEDEESDEDESDEEDETESEDDEDEESEDEDEEDEDVEEAPKKSKKVAKPEKKGKVKVEEKPAKKAKTKGEVVEKDNWGFRKGTRTSRINEAISDKPLGIAELEKKAKATAISSHLRKLVDLGLVVRKDGKYSLSKLGAKKRAKVSAGK